MRKDSFYNLNDDDEINNDLEIKFKHVKIDIPGAKLKNASRAIQKIGCLKQLDLPVDSLSNLSEKLTISNEFNASCTYFIKIVFIILITMVGVLLNEKYNC